MEEEIAQIKELQRRITFYEDMKAYEELYLLLSDGLRRFSYAYVKSKEAAEEIVSDVFIKVWQMRARLPEIDNLKVYCYTITHNFSYNYLTRHYKTFVSLDEINPETAIEVGDPETLCISADMLDKIRSVIQQLPPQCRIIFQLVKEEGMRYKEVAAVLNISVNTVRNQVATASRKIAGLLPASLGSAELAFLRRFSDS